MLIDPQECQLGGGLYWRELSPEGVPPNTYFHIQQHMIQPASGLLGAAISKYRRVVKQDEHSDFTFRIITKLPPYLIVAYGQRVEEIVDDWKILEECYFFSWSEHHMASTGNPERAANLKLRINLLRTLQLNPESLPEHRCELDRLLPPPRAYQTLGRTHAAAAREDDLEGPASTDGNRNECVICMEAEVNSALVPCGHAVTCMDCASQLPGNRCPMCRADIERVIRIYLPSAQ